MAERPDFVFLTGDLGYKALEPLRDALGPRFINAGVAEQNMVGVAAGLARGGFRPWVYSIAPFIYARPFEQIRNDICLHRLPVIVVGNGGGYGYGVMGATHHALEDYGTLLSLPHIRAVVPAFDTDVPALVEQLCEVDHPAYLRLGLDEAPAGVPVPPYAPWRRLLAGSSGVAAVVGPLIGGIWDYCLRLPVARRPALWLLSELPPRELDPAFLCDVRRTGRLLVVEEHVAQGGLGQMLASRLLEAGAAPAWFRVCAALGYPSGLYGSQQFHRHECGLDPATVISQLLEAVPEGVPQ
jgi:transketolase